MPALLYPVNSAVRVYQEEQFCPVVTVVKYEDIETPISYLIESNYGKQASIFGSDPEEIARLVDPRVNQVCRPTATRNSSAVPILSPLPEERTPLREPNRYPTSCGCFHYARWWRQMEMS